MRFLLAGLLVLLQQVTLAQEGSPVWVPGTKCSLIPPEGFEAATRFTGFQHPDHGAAIMIFEFPAPYAQLSRGFTVEAFQRNGMKLLEKREFDFHGYQATIASVSHTVGDIVLRKKMLVFGNIMQSVMLNAMYPDSLPQLGPVMERALLSTIYNPSLQSDPLGAAGFSVDAESSGFKFTKLIAGNLLYTMDGKPTTNGPALIVSNSIGTIYIDDLRDYAMERLRKHPGSRDVPILKEGKVTVDNMQGYEIVALGVNKYRQPRLIYQLMLFDEHGYYLIIGTSGEDPEKYERVFGTVARTFRRKI